MKKAVAIISIFAVLFSLSACKIKKDLSAEEVAQSYAAEESKKIQESIKVEEDYSAGVAENANEIGKTVKNEKLVVEFDDVLGYEYHVFVMNKKGISKYKLIYRFYDSITNYEEILEQPDTKNSKIVEHNDAARMIVYKYTNIPERSFDELYKEYSSELTVKMGYKIIE